jgi:hypothetical protein
MPFGRPFRAISLCVFVPRAEALGCFLFARRALGTRTRKCPNSRARSAWESATPKVRCDSCRCAHRFDDWNPRWCFSGPGNGPLHRAAARTSSDTNLSGREFRFCLRNTAHISTRNTSGISYARSYRTLRDGPFEGRFPRHFVPGYDRTVPPGHMGTATALNAEMSKLRPGRSCRSCAISSVATSKFIR